MINSTLIKFASLINVTSVFQLDEMYEFDLENGFYLYVPAGAKEFIDDVRLDSRIFLNEYKNPDCYIVTSANKRIRLKVEICPDQICVNIMIQNLDKVKQLFMNPKKWLFKLISPHRYQDEGILQHLQLLHLSKIIIRPSR